MDNRWKNLSECGDDFLDILEKVKTELNGVGDYTKILDNIEQEIQNYIDMDEKEWLDVYENNEISDIVYWYTGAIDTESFCEDYLESAIEDEKQRAIEDADEIQR